MRTHTSKGHPAGKKPIRPIQKRTTIGGQALIEGLMMIGPAKKAMALRKPDGSIYVEESPIALMRGTANWPFVRGSIRLFRQLISGTKALLRSAELLEETPAETPADQPADEAAAQAGQPAAATDPAASPVKPRQGRVERFIENHPDLVLYAAAVLGLLLSVALFILLPNLIASFVGPLIGLEAMRSAGHKILLNLIEGLIRIAIFLGYLILATRMKDIRRVWMYHGAEHKSIACYEARQPLLVENARSFSRFHPRCGTAFLFIVIILSIIVFSLFGWWGRWLNLLIRFALVPVIAGIAYEIIRLAGRHDNWLTRLLTAPGLWLQRLTTAEPDDAMLEVAIAALERVIPQEPQSDNW